ncbi:c-type cytochrome [Massilia niastensis]|uniref:c-type cytochrome n=1 Tax=Massilia niastensis TaxID=544911 RepID=UPI00039E1306|nr:cytochrome c [Massilia niastensis]
MIIRTVLLTLLAVGVTAAAAGMTVLRAGWYNIGATQQHHPLVHKVLEKGMHYSVRFHAREVRVPALGAPQQVLRGAAVYRDRCVQCHGAPGVAQDRHGMSMQPVPGPLVDATARWKPRELYWITRHGVKMSGMPAWEYHLSDEDLWAVVAFVASMPALTPDQYRGMAGPEAQP